MIFVSFMVKIFHAGFPPVFLFGDKILSLFSFLSLFISLSSHAEDITLHHLQGEWLNKDYYETLIVTKSPHKAVQGIYNTSFTISKNDTHYKWFQIFNFHEGIYFIITGLQPTPESNTYRIQFREQQDSGHATVHDTFLVPDTQPVNEIVWSFMSLYSKPEGTQNISYVRIKPDIQTFVNRTVLAGTYEDDKGRTFIFGESGIARWPDTTFTYKTGLDYIFAKFDYFWVYGNSDPSMNYVFQWKDNRLLIYETYYSKEVSERIEPCDKPLHVLRPR